MVFKVTTWNVNGVRAREAQVLEWIAREQPDVLCLQEVKASPSDVPPTLAPLPGYWGHWHGHKGYSGVSLHLRQERFPEPAFTHPPFDLEQRIVCAEVEDLIIASIYVPNGGKDLPMKMRFLEELDAFAASAQASGKRLLLCGDLNVARAEIDVHPKLRKPGQIGTTEPERALMERIISRGLVDLGRHFAPDDDQLFTWWAPWRDLKAKNVGWRIDYVLVSQGLSAQSCVSRRDFGTSDHGPVVAELELGAFAGAGSTPASAPAPEPEKPKGQLTLF
jgi:exodeoxyribonuclease-3